MHIVREKNEGAKCVDWRTVFQMKERKKESKKERRKSYECDLNNTSLVVAKVPPAMQDGKPAAIHSRYSDHAFSSRSQHSWYRKNLLREKGWRTIILSIFLLDA